VAAVDDGFYFRPEGPHVLISPADETPSAPCDARAEESDVALAIERVNRVTDLAIRSVVTAWAGLRTFAPDRNPVVGFDPRVPGLFWLAGQGGYGIQMAPALARLAAALVRGDSPAATGLGDLDLPRLSPGRTGDRRRA
jgi:D-arginine dehydrogenase